MLALGLIALPAALPLPAHAADRLLAQDPEAPDQTDEGVVGEGDEAENPGTEGEAGQDPDAETGAGQGEQESAEPEAGPLWTYQMSRIGLVLLFLMLLGIGGAYWNFVGKRTKQGV